VFTEGRWPFITAVTQEYSTAALNKSELFADKGEVLNRGEINMCNVRESVWEKHD